MTTFAAEIYRICAETFMLASLMVSPALCVLVWLLLGTAFRKQLRSYIHWCTPLAFGGTFTASAIILMAFVTFFDRRDYGLASVSYLLGLAGIRSTSSHLPGSGR